MKYSLNEILRRVIKDENHKETGIWRLDSDYRGGKLNIQVEGSEKLNEKYFVSSYMTYNYYNDKKFYDEFIKEFGNLKIETSQIRGMGYFPTIAGYEAIVSNLKTLNPDYLIFKMPVQEKAPSGKIIIPQGKNEVFTNLMIDIANFLEQKYK
ncbi:MAG: hypothetical protein M1416_00400 [Candidatus Pacearchaeota archaeon]|nr:hypothetical protein [Candidatus Pacearchaeota archaeon]